MYVCLDMRFDWKVCVKFVFAKIEVKTVFIIECLTDAHVVRLKGLSYYWLLTSFDELCSRFALLQYMENIVLCPSKAVGLYTNGAKRRWNKSQT